MDERRARAVVDGWLGGSGVVPRGPKVLLGVVPATLADVERHAGAEATGTRFWRLVVGGRFLASAGLVYPSGVPFPEELHSQSAVVANEVWLYVDDSGRLLGAYWWPDAVRRPIASVPKAQFSPDDVIHPSDLVMDIPLRLPSSPLWEAAVAVRTSSRDATVFYVKGTTPEPLHEMVVYEQGGLSLHVGAAPTQPDLNDFLLRHQPPFRRVSVRNAFAVGRDPGRALGPQTWPWPAELRWWENGVSYELKGFSPLAKLQSVANS